MREIVDKVYSQLFEDYKIRGADFYFKARHIAKYLGLPPGSVGHACQKLYDEGKLDCWNIRRVNSKTWKTIFSNGGSLQKGEI